jgi:hypothetical protein
LNSTPPSPEEDAQRVARRNKITAAIIMLIVAGLIITSGTSLLTKMQ